MSDSVFINSNEIPDNNLDDDSNGYIDDINGWNFYDSNNQTYSDVLSDYHGTVIAGIIASSHQYNNYKGIAPDVRILPVKCFAGSKGEISDTVKGIEYAINIGAAIINLSWDTKVLNDELYDIIKKNEDVPFICSAGKSMKNLDDLKTYPASFNLDNVISVAAIDSEGQLFFLSNYGTSVDLAAPGVDIYSILPENEYMFTEGTSMAVAHVTGIAALLKSYNANLTPAKIKQIMKQGSIVDDKLTNKVSTNGYLSAEKCFEILLQN